MKRTFLSLLALIAMGSSVMAGETPVISVADVYARPGDVVSFSVNLEDGKADTYTGMTLYAQFPTTGFTTTGSPIFSDKWVAATGSVGAVGATTPGLATIPMASENKITGSVVKNLVTISFEVANTVEPGEYDVTLQGTMFEYNLSDKDYAADVTFTVHVIDRVPLDENSTIAPTAQNGVNVTVIRTIQAGVWNTICLPFAMTEAQLKAAFGNDVQLCQLSIVNGIVRNGEDFTIIFSTKNVNEGIVANTPYIIKTSSDVTSFVANGVNIVAGPAESFTLDPSNYTQMGKFIGTLKAGTTIPENNLFLNANKLYYSTGSTVIKGFRGYFWLKDFNPSANAPTFKVDGGTTRVEGISVITDDGTIYNLNGQKVEAPAQKGVYIKNGKKVILK